MSPPHPKKRLLLELFKGTGSVGAVFQRNGYCVVSLDNDDRWQPDICSDVMRWDYRSAGFGPGEFDVIWASPPCTEYSRALTTRPRNLRAANRIVRRVLDIIAYFRPRLWFVENPATGVLKDQAIVRGLRYVDVDYCQFSDWGYQKPTRIWYDGDIRLRDVCCNGIGCRNMVATRGGNRRRHRLNLCTVKTGLGPRPSLEMKYRVPPRLVSYVAGLDKV
jgi:hypothetical protein